MPGSYNSLSRQQVRQLCLVFYVQRSLEASVILSLLQQMSEPRHATRITRDD
jgi:hypothetical protein